jgi:methyl-accepting chemotaxis protein
VRQRSINSSTVKAGVVVLGGTIIAGLVGGGAAWTLNEEIAATNDISQVLRNHLEGDMMHDALRSDVLAAFVARNPASGLDIAEVNADLADHTENFRALLNANIELTADNAQLSSVITAVAPALNDYIVAATDIVAKAAVDEAAALAALPSFFDAFRELEVAMEQASDKISTVSDAQVSEGATFGLLCADRHTCFFAARDRHRDRNHDRHSTHACQATSRHYRRHGQAGQRRHDNSDKTWRSR